MANGWLNCIRQSRWLKAKSIDPKQIRSLPAAAGSLFSAARNTRGVLSMKLAFICPPVPGHLNPMTALARELQARNHDVVFLYSSGTSGLPCVPGPEKDHINENRGQTSKMQGEDVLKFGLRLVMSQTEAILKSLPAIVQANRVDALLLDTIQFYAELGPMQLGMPYIHVSNALHLDYSGYTPLQVYGWPHETTPEALARNREGVAQWAKILGEANAVIRAHAESAGLEVDWEDLDSTLSPLASITQTPRAFDFESSHWSPQFHHTGPFHDGNDREQIGPVPSNAIIVKQAPQLELLKQTSVCITHAGLNTVLESLAQGVPQVAIPVTYDQPGVAARIGDKKTGVVTSLDELTADHLSTLLDEVLDNGVYRENARRLQDIIAKTNGLSMAADIVERSFGCSKKDLHGN